MAKAQEGCGGAGSLEAELTCPICLGVYQEPVSLACGHNFCRPARLGPGMNLVVKHWKELPREVVESQPWR
uniref:Zinc finger RING-type eukaryotic domain-containing protein n=1 Tax=Catharus ustulatus TaxID=91951 RepID=A0A8C3Y0L4_CATUS